MKTILLYPQLEFAGAQIPIPPYSILFIADYLIRKGVDTEIFDMRFDSIAQVFDSISDNQPEYIGLSVMTGPQIYEALKLSKILKKEFKNIKIVWGGIHPTILPTQTLQSNLIDFVIRGEGEKSYYELATGKEKSSIDGLSLKQGNKIIHNPKSPLIKGSELNELSIPWDLIDPKRYIRNQSFTIITSRGCPYQCAFCYNTLFNNVWRGWSTEKCIKELDTILNLGASKINFYDDNFFANPKRVKTLFPFFKEQDIIWKAELRVDHLTLSLAKEAKEHGCDQMYFGVESGSQKVLDILNKSIKIKDIISSAKIAEEVGIVGDYSWMIGIPGENRSDIQKTISLIKRVKNIHPNSEFSIKILFPYPKTVIFDSAIKQGFKPPSTLLGWSKIRRERAPLYLNNKNYLETISITSAIVGRKIFEQQNAPVFKLIRAPADFRWKKEIFGVGIENALFKVFRSLIDKVISRKGPLEYDIFSQEIVATNNK